MTYESVQVTSAVYGSMWVAQGRGVGWVHARPRRRFTQLQPGLNLGE